MKCRLLLFEKFLYFLGQPLGAKFARSNFLMADDFICNEGRHVFQGDLVNKNDNDLAEAMLEGNVEALGILVDRYQHLVFTIAFRIVRDKGEAEDLVQDVFLEIFRKVKLFDPSKGIFRVWLLRYAYTRSMNRRDHLEHRRFYTTVELDEAGPLVASHRDLFGGSLTVQEATRYVQQALEILNPKQRKAIDLIALEGMTVEEAAHIMGYSVAATRNYYYRGVMALRAFGTDQVRPFVEERIQDLAVGHAKHEVAHFKARTA
jgi:RNA polymerase sigma-70 factor (ECF subfamily)